MLIPMSSGGLSMGVPWGGVEVEMKNQVMRSATALVFTLQFLLPRLSQAKTVMMLPPTAKSYIIYHSNIAQALIELGHNVSLCVPHYLVNKGLVQHKGINVINYGEHLGDAEAYVYKNSKIIDNYWAGKTQTFQSVLPFLEAFKEIIDKILSDENFVSSIRDLKPDFMILENFMFTRNILVLPYKLDVPFGLISTLHDYFINRVPFSPASDPLFFEQVNKRKSFFERVQAVIMSAMFMYFDIFSDSDIVSRYAPERPYATIKEIALKAEIFIAETDHILDFPRPALPNTRLVGGSSAGEARPLTGSLKTFVEKSINGIAVVSFGSGDMNVPTDIITKMKEAFIKTGIHFVWKINWTSDQPDKILTLNWIPQNDLLGHQNTKLFISHCGKNGQYEALHHGVPILCLPIYGDQFYNANRVSTKEFGLHVDIRKTTADELANQITRVTSDPKYKSNIHKASTLYRELYKVPSKEAAYWFDHVMKYGGGYMRSSGQEMPLYQFLLLDVAAFLLFISFIVLLTLYFTVNFFLRRISLLTERKMKIA
ncbi:hypothetical protein Btru_023143 [Bulinus truncatus]|nr:hypothetical protein Btru_023143 [Bulinus truncatus]